MVVEDRSSARMVTSMTKPDRLRAEESAEGIAVRPAKSRLVVLLLAIAWNVVLAPFFFAHHRPGVAELVYLVTAWTVLVLLAARELVLVTRFTVSGKVLTIRVSPPVPWSRGLSLPVADVDRFEVRAEKDASQRLYIVLRTGEGRKVPLSLDGPPLKGNWTTKVMFAAPVETYSWVATRLSERVEDARRETGPTYR